MTAPSMPWAHSLLTLLPINFQNMDYIWPLNFLNLTCAQFLNNHQNRFIVPVANFFYRLCCIMRSRLIITAKNTFSQNVEKHYFFLTIAFLNAF